MAIVLSKKKNQRKTKDGVQQGSWPGRIVAALRPKNSTPPMLNLSCPTLPGRVQMTAIWEANIREIKLNANFNLRTLCTLHLGIKITGTLMGTQKNNPCQGQARKCHEPRIPVMPLQRQPAIEYNTVVVYSVRSIEWPPTPCPAEHVLPTCVRPPTGFRPVGSILFCPRTLKHSQLTVLLLMYYILSM